MEMLIINISIQIRMLTNFKDLIKEGVASKISAWQRTLK